MRMKKRSEPAYVFAMLTAVVSLWALLISARAQTSTLGYNGVCASVSTSCTTSGNTTSSPSFIDASP
jgi:hypothetical protein